MGPISKFIANNKETRLKIVVAGDCMIDEYYYTSVTRLSPEFPIPVMKSWTDMPDEALPGGAANVAYQFSEFNVDVSLAGIVNDYAKQVFRGINLDCSIDPNKTRFWGRNCHVPIKRRFYHQEFPMCRWDIEREDYNLLKLESCLKLINLPKSDVILFSDYNKGVFSTDWYREYIGKAITIVDPKNDLEKWRGVSIIKPNAVEAEKLTGEKKWMNQCNAIQNATQCESVVITQGGEGVVGFANGHGFFEYRPSRKPNNVNSVVGAGDCFMAFLAMGVGYGMPLAEAAELAYEAGAIYVQNKHNKPLNISDLISSFDQKIINREIVSSLPKHGLVFTNGCFDVLHQGHLDLFKFAAQQGEKLIVAVNSDESVARLKGSNRPVNKLESRMNMVAAMDCVDYVVSFEEDTPEEILKEIMPSLIVKGGDYQPDQVVGKEIAPVKICPLTNGYSSTGIISKIKS